VLLRDAGEREGVHANAALLQRLGVDLELIGEDDRSAFSQLVKVELHRLRRQGEHEVYRVAVGEPLLLRETYLVEVVAAPNARPVVLQPEDVQPRPRKR